MKVYVVYGVLEERDTGMIVDHYVMTYDVFSSKDEADKMVEWLKRKNKYGEFIAKNLKLSKLLIPIIISELRKESDIMAEYLKRDDVLTNSEILTVDTRDYGRIDVVPVEYLADIPSADVQPVKHGYWEEVIDYGGWGDTHYHCSVCGEEWYLEDGKPKDNNMNFCPRCGARMDLKDGDTNG